MDGGSAKLGDTVTSSPVYCQQCGGRTRLELRHGRERPVCVTCGAITWYDPRLAVAVILARNGRVLLGRRAEGSREAGRWSLPAGFVDRGEVVEQAAARELREETGIEATIGALAGVYSYDGEPVVLLVFEAGSFSGEPRPGDDLDQIGWFSVADLPPLAFEHDREIITAYLARRGSDGEEPDG